MKMNFLAKNIALVGFSTWLVACGGPGEGYDPNLNTQAEINFSDDAPAAYTVNEADADANNKYRIDLFAGATVNGQPLSEYTGTVNITSFEFDGEDGGPLTGVSPPRVDRRTPFSIEGSQLVIDFSVAFLTEPEDPSTAVPWLGDRLRECWEHVDDLPLDSDGNPMGDGIPDFPSTITYTIDYVVDNGFPPTQVPDENEPTGVRTVYPGEHTITLTMNAKPDVTVEMVAAPIEIAAGESAQLEVTRVPYYACDSDALTYTSTTPDIASVDENGVVTGLSGGTAVINVVHDDSGLSRDFDVVVTDNFKISVTNAGDDPSNLSKSVPACAASAIEMQPIQKSGESLVGDYMYEWMSGAIDVVDPTAVDAISAGYGENAVLIPNMGESSEAGNIASTSPVDVSVSFVSGDTGSSTDPVEDAVVAVSVVENIACLDANPVDSTPFTMDHTFDTRVAPWAGINAAVTVDQAVGEGVRGAALRMQIVDDSDPEFMAIWPNTWSSGPENLYASMFGNLSDNGKTFRTAIWVKLPSAKSGVVLEHYIFPWQFTNHELLNSEPGGGWGGRRNSPISAKFTSGELEATTEWQYVEFVNMTDTSTPWFTIPTTWDNVNTANGGVVVPTATVMGNFVVRGLEATDTILLDDYAIIER